MKLIVKTLYGAEDILSRELEQLGAKNITSQRRAVNCEGDTKTLYKINLWSRFALRVLVPVLDFQADTADELYSAVYAFDWQKYLSPDKTIAIDHISFSPTFPDSQFLALKTKDAIVDKMRDKCGARPYVDVENPDILLNVHATSDGIKVSLDASGAPLNKRGYRDMTVGNATNEALAAALVELSGWTPDMALIDPMCGTGTICIEAAMKARNIAANFYRKHPFGFTQWVNFDERIWKDVRQEAKQVQNNCRLNIIGSDNDSNALDVAKLATLDLGLNHDIRIIRKSLREQERTTEDGIIITVPPAFKEVRIAREETDPDAPRRRYADRDRFERVNDMDDFFKEATYYLSRKFPDHDAWIFNTNLKAMDAIEYSAEKTFTIYNGSQEGRFCLYPF